MTEEAIVCPGCGAKVRASRERCPRCRAFLTTSAVEEEAPSSGVGGKVAAGLLALAVVATVVILWNGRAEPESPATPGKAAAAAPIGTPRSPAAAAAAQAPSGEIPPAPAFVLSSRLNLPSQTADEATLERLRAAIGRDSQDVASLLAAGRVLLELGRVREALGLLRQATDLEPGNWGYAFVYGHAAARAEDWAEAAAGFRRARSLAPEDAPTSYNLALVRQRLTDYAGAVEEYNAAIGLDSGAAAPRLGLAISLDRLGKTADAVAAYSAYLRLMPSGGPDADRAQARLKRLGG